MPHNPYDTQPGGPVRRIVGAGEGKSGVGTLVVARREPFHASRPMSNVHHPSNVLLLCMVLTLAVIMQTMHKRFFFDNSQALIMFPRGLSLKQLSGKMYPITTGLSTFI